MVPAQTKSTVPAVSEFSAAKLLSLLKHRAESTATDVASQFEAVHRLVESMPLTSAEFCFAHNWLTSAQVHWQFGDTNTAHHQLSMVVRKLKLYRTKLHGPSWGVR